MTFTKEPSIVKNAPQEQQKQTSVFDSPEKTIQLFRKLTNVYDNRPDEMSFIGAQDNNQNEDIKKQYTKEAIQADIAYVAKRKKQIAEANASSGKAVLENNEESFQHSEIMQAMIVDCINEGWFGDMKAMMSSEYDDIAKGVDAIMQSKDAQRKNTYIGTSFDFTLAEKPDHILKKLTKNWQRSVEEGKVPSVKYFIDPDTKEKRSLSLPKCIVIGTNQDIEELATAYLENNEQTKRNHPFRFTMIDQIEEQLDKAIVFFQQEKELRPDIGTKYDFAEKVYTGALASIRAMKKSINMQDTLTQHPEIYQTMKESKGTAIMRNFLQEKTTLDQYTRANSAII